MNICSGVVYLLRILCRKSFHLEKGIAKNWGKLSLEIGVDLVTEFDALIVFLWEEVTAYVWAIYFLHSVSFVDIFSYFWPGFVATSKTTINISQTFWQFSQNAISLANPSPAMVVVNWNYILQKFTFCVFPNETSIKIGITADISRKEITW